MESKRIVRHIDRLLLDPNNYRFIDRPEYKFVPDDQLVEDVIQRRTLNLLQGKNNENIKDLISSFTSNGFLDIEQIQVKAVGEKYLVLEGNRRTATLKHLYEEFKKDNPVGLLTEKDFKSIDLVEIIGEDPVQHLITMGLHHISGKKRWSAVNEAQLVSDLIYKYKKTEDEVCESLGISKQKLRKSVRTLSLIEQYKDSDFGDEFKTDMYSIFESVIGSPAIKEWIEWDDDDYLANNNERLDRFFSWISPTEVIIRDEDGIEQSINKEPIIRQYREIKELSEFINDEKAIKRMEESRSISDGYKYSDAIGEARLKSALNNIKSEANTAFYFSEYMTDYDFDEVNKLKIKLDGLIPKSKAFITINEKKASQYFQSISNQFDQLDIIRYRKLTDIHIKHISKVNIFAGGNNMGKTSILESFYLLTQLNDINAFLELEKYRGKFYNEFHAKWVDKNFISTIDISGNFNGTLATILITKEETEEDIEKTSYLSTIKADARVNGIDLLSSVYLYGNREPELRYVKSQILCPASFTSPYRYNESLLRKAHAHAVQEKYFDEVIDFIRLHLDNSIEKIDLVSIEGESRFIVTSANLDKGIDITKYGEGLQRVFEIALLMCFNSNGILCIDEIDSAIHKSLLIPFTEFIQNAAERFNVQVFLSTHSKECIDAFIANGYANDDITAYHLSMENDKIVCKYIDGKRLELLIENINIDIR